MLFHVLQHRMLIRFLRSGCGVFIDEIGVSPLLLFGTVVVHGKLKSSLEDEKTKPFGYKVVIITKR